ncbi:MAG: Sua5/YciO/YrdC/YwlC family protein [Permianibacter sp.]
MAQHPSVPAWRQQPLRNVLASDGVIAYPTEGVWGLGCLPDCLTAVQRILDLKRRPAHKGLILVAAAPEQLSPWIDWGALPLDRLTEILGTWPGAITWVLPTFPHVSPLLRGKFDTLAVRVSAHPVVRELCLRHGPLVSTSANHAGRRAAKTELQVRQWFNNEIDAVIPGKLGGRKGPSEIRDGLTGESFRL